MNYHRLLLFVLVCSCSLSLSAQNKVLLNIAMDPGKTYKTEVATEMDMEMNAKVDSATMASLIASGMKFPMKIHMKQEIGTTTKTGSRQADNKIPVTMTYDKLIAESTVGGQEAPPSQNPFANAVIEGHTMGDFKVTIDTIKGEMDESLRTSLRQMVNSIQENIKYPKQEMKIGDSFQQEVPMKMPIPGMDLSMKLVIKYVLREIKNDKATFDMQQQIVMDMTNAGNSNKGNGSGAGTGVMVYNIAKKIPEASDSNIQFQLDFNVSGLQMSAKCDTKTQTSTSIL